MCFIFVVFCLSKYGGKGNLLRPLLYGPVFWKKLQIVIRVRFSSITLKQNISLQWKWLAFLKLKVRRFLHYDVFSFKRNYQPAVLLSMSGMFVCEQCQKRLYFWSNTWILNNKMSLSAYHFCKQIFGWKANTVSVLNPTQCSPLPFFISTEL